MKTHNETIARLPRKIREQLNRRLHNGEPDNVLIKWLNSRSTVQSSAQTFGPPDLEEWKSAGYRDWVEHQDALAGTEELAAQAKELENTAGGSVADAMATVLAGRFARALVSSGGVVNEELLARLQPLRQLCADTTELRRGDHDVERLKLERERLALARANSEQEREKEFWEWVKRPEVQEKLYPNREGGVTEATLEKISRELNLL